MKYHKTVGKDVKAFTIWQQAKTKHHEHIYTYLLHIY
jgi:hypothetical protein